MFEERIQRLSLACIKCSINDFFVIRKLHNVHTCKGMIRKKKNKVVGVNTENS